MNKAQLRKNKVEVNSNKLNILKSTWILYPF